VPGSDKGWVLVKDAVKKKPPDGLPYPAALRGEGAPEAEAEPEAAPDAVAEEAAP
jgi:large subunit ribosomal protein L3